MLGSVFTLSTPPALLSCAKDVAKQSEGCVSCLASRAELPWEFAWEGLGLLCLNWTIVRPGPQICCPDLCWPGLAKS